MPIEIDDSDEISRCIIYSRAFRDRVHCDDLLWPFGQSKEDGAAHESAILRRLAPTEQEVHDIGCIIEAQQNVARLNPSPGPKKRYYCGFRSASMNSLPREGDGFSIRFSHLPENGIDAHVDVALFVHAESRNARANCRTLAGLMLAEQFGPASPYVCACNENDEHHPIHAFGVECLESRRSDRWPGIVSIKNID